jgi:hypothetical protein
MDKYILDEEKQDALRSMGLYFEELPLFSQCAFNEVCSAAKNGEGVSPLHYRPFVGEWMGKLADEKHYNQLLQHFCHFLKTDFLVPSFILEHGYWI